LTTKESIVSNSISSGPLCTVKLTTKFQKNISFISGNPFDQEIIFKKT